MRSSHVPRQPLELGGAFEGFAEFAFVWPCVVALVFSIEDGRWVFSSCFVLLMVRLDFILFFGAMGVCVLG